MNDDYFYESMAAEPFFLALLHQGSGKQILDAINNFKYLGGFGIMLVDDVSRKNRVFINPQTNIIEVDYHLSDNDKIRFKKALRSALYMLFERGAQEIFLPTSELILSDELHYQSLISPDQIDMVIENIHFIENQTFLSSSHMQGTNKMEIIRMHQLYQPIYGYGTPILMQKFPISML